LPSTLNHGLIDELPPHRDSAITSLNSAVERCDHALSVLNLVRRGAENIIDDGDLSGMKG